MINGAITAGTPAAASPATDEAAEDAAMLSRMVHLAEELASGFQAQGVAALAAGDLDRAGKAEAGFSTLFRGMRRAVALKARMRQQREDARRKATAHKDRLQGETDDRRHAVAQGLSQAIAVVSPEFHERFTADLWERLTETDRIDADLADTALPVETLIRRLGRQIGLADSAIAYGLDPALAKARAARVAARTVWSPAVAPAGDDNGLDDTEDESTESMHICGISAADLGLPGDEIYEVRIDTGEVFDNNDDDDVDIVIMRLPVPDEPWRHDAPEIIRQSARAMAAERAVPREPDPPVSAEPPETDDERRRRERAAEARGFGLTLPDSS